MFRGSCTARTDEKGRLKVPAAFLAELKEKDAQEFFITSLNGQSARIYPMEAWNQVEQRLAQVGSTNIAKRKFLNLVNYYGQVVTIDKQGRLLLPALLRESASLKGEVVVVGGQEFLEVWTRQRFVEDVRKSALTQDDLASLGELGV